VCWKPRSSCWSFHLLRQEFLSAPIHTPLSGSPYWSFMRAKIKNPTDPHSLALVSGSRTNANMSSRQFSLSCLVSMPDEEFDVLGKEDLTLLSRRFERM
jgi:hypothetical protein